MRPSEKAGAVLAAALLCATAAACGTAHPGATPRAPASTAPATSACAAAGTPGAAADGPVSPCLAEGWSDMTRGFVDYYAQHLTKADDGMWPSVVAVRMHRQGGRGKAVVTVNFVPLGSGGWQGRRVAEVFGDWRGGEYGDQGVLRVESPTGALITERPW
ncbi:hypothetical protein ABZX93_14305 [Streptomyces sp. NPDC006632]|uniref:hypothetical protein n=1 Tax=Streptomyces sp. NPDC006632 TaxID=3157182 RepID=UPI0033A27644